jgi:hypothetical protein
MTDLERNVTKGRFLLEKKHKFALPAQARVICCDKVVQGNNILLCIG